MSKKEQSVEFTQDYLDEFLEYETIEEIVLDQWAPLFKGYEYMVVSGSKGTWQGRYDMDLTVIFSSDFSDFLSHLEVNQLTIEFFHDRVEVKNVHHDGSNYYTIRPFCYDMLQDSDLKRLLRENDLMDDLSEYLTILDSARPSYGCHKDSRVDFLNDIEELDVLSGISEEEFVVKHMVNRPKWTGEENEK